MIAFDSISLISIAFFLIRFRRDRRYSLVNKKKSRMKNLFEKIQMNSETNWKWEWIDDEWIRVFYVVFVFTVLPISFLVLSLSFRLYSSSTDSFERICSLGASWNCLMYVRSFVMFHTHRRRPTDERAIVNAVDTKTTTKTGTETNAVYTNKYIEFFDSFTLCLLLSFSVIRSFDYIQRICCSL